MVEIIPVIFTHNSVVNLLSCNVNGLRQPGRISKFVDHFIFPTGSDPSPHILALQETHSTSVDGTKLGP